MTSLWAIIKLTFRSAIRSHIFQLLLVILLFCVISIPLSIADDGTAWGFFQISLKYSLGVVGFVLSLSTVWLSCYVMTTDVESYQLHMVISKPISRIKIWLGKCLGIILIHLILIIVATTVTYFLIEYEYSHKDFSKLERQRVRNEVLVGRRAFMPKMPDVNKIVAMEYRRRLKIAADNGADIAAIKKKEKKVLAELRKEFLAGLNEVRPFMTRIWVYEGINPKLNAPLYLRFKPYVGKISPKKTQRKTKGIWFAELNIKMKAEEPVSPTKKVDQAEARLKKKNKTNRPSVQAIWAPRTEMPESLMCGSYNEVVIPENAVNSKGYVVIGFTNFDPEGKPIFFQTADGPKLFIKVCGFPNNYARAVLMILLRVIFLATLSCAIASFVSMPVAIFSVISYMFFGIFATYLVGAEQDLLDSGAGLGSMEIMEQIGTIVSKLLLIVVIPLQNFEVSDKIASGELVEWSYIATILVNFFLLRGVPLAILGIFLYWRREMGLVIKK